MTEYLSRYIYLNENKDRKKLEISFYEFGGLRMIPLDHNYCLKFNYFNSTSKNIDSAIEETIIFFNGFVVFTSVTPEVTLFFYNYYYSLGEPFVFDESKLIKRFSHLPSHNALTQCRYGYFINAAKYGTERKLPKKDNNEQNEDLLGLEEEEVVKGIEILIAKEGKQK